MVIGAITTRAGQHLAEIHSLIIWLSEPSAAQCIRLTHASSLVAALALCCDPGGATAQTGKHFLWKVEDARAPSAYLLGSLHVLTSDAYPLPAPIDKAFAESKTLVEEVDLDEMSDPTQMMAALSKAMLTDGKTLDQLISPEVYAEVKKRAESHGLPMMALQRMKPGSSPSR